MEDVLAAVGLAGAAKEIAEEARHLARMEHELGGTESVGIPLEYAELLRDQALVDF